MPVVRRLLPALICSLLIAAAAPAASHAADAFSTPPDPLPAGAPGDILRAEPLQPRALDARLGGAGRAWRVLYLSTNATGARIAVTGTVILPSRRAPRALVGFAPGSQGLADGCAPSRQLREGTLYEGIALTAILQRGWAVAMTDYEGLGTPGMHTYMVGRSAGPSVLDALRAARRLPDAGIGDDLPTAVMGYSQGGNAAGWAAQLEASYAPELELRGVAAGGVPSDLAAVQREVDGGPYAAVMVLGGLGLEAAYGVDIDRYHTLRGTREYYEATHDCIIVSLLKNAFRRIATVTTFNPLGDPDVRARMEENRLGTIAPAMPVLLQHGRFDDVVPAGQARAVHDAWCARGAAVTWRTVALDHAGGYFGTLPRAIRWLGSRLTGVPDTGDCG